MRRRSLLAGAAALTVSAAFAPAFAQFTPTQPIELVVHGGPGSGNDVMARQMVTIIEQEKLTPVRVQVSNRTGGGERIAALLGGHVDLMIMDPSEAGEQVKAGKLRVIAQIGDERLPEFKDVATLTEQGFKIPDVPQTRGVVGPPGMPAAAVAYYEGMLDKLRQTAGWKKFLADSQLENVNEKSAATQKFLTAYEEQLRGILKEAGAKVVR